MTTKQLDKIKELMAKLKKELAKEYPARHWNHLNIWAGYWSLFDRLKKN